MPRTTVPIDKAGRVVLPKPVRDRFGLRQGDELVLEERGEVIELRPVRPAVTLKKVGGVLVVAGKAASVEADLLADSREERLEHLTDSAATNRQ